MFLILSMAESAARRPAPAARTATAQIPTVSRWTQAQAAAAAPPNTPPTASPIAPPTPNGAVKTIPSPAKADLTTPAHRCQRARQSR
jgi:hypothetical protein